MSHPARSFLRPENSALQRKERKRRCYTRFQDDVEQQAEIETVTRSLHEKEAQIEMLTQQAEASQRLQRQVATLEARLGRAEK